MRAVSETGMRREMRIFNEVFRRWNGQEMMSRAVTGEREEFWMIP